MHRIGRKRRLTYFLGTLARDTWSLCAESIRKNRVRWLSAAVASRGCDERSIVNWCSRWVVKRCGILSFAASGRITWIWAARRRRTWSAFVSDEMDLWFLFRFCNIAHDLWSSVSHFSKCSFYCLSYSYGCCGLVMTRSKEVCRWIFKRLGVVSSLYTFCCNTESI